MPCVAYNSWKKSRALADPFLPSQPNRLHAPDPAAPIAACCREKLR